MKRPFPRALLAGAIFGLMALTPALAQVAGNPGDLHTPTLYMQQYKALHGYTARAPEPAKALEGADSNCGLVHDFNTSQTHFQYIAVCPMPPFH